jgi:replicative DNA helicase
MLERDPDFIGLLWRKQDQPLEDKIWDYRMVIAKNRDGDIGKVPFVFKKCYTKFEAVQERVE